MKTILLYLAFVYLLVLSACSQKVQEGTAPEEEPLEEMVTTVSLNEEEIKLGGVALGTITYKSLSGGLKVNGVLDVPPEQLIAITAPLGGIIEKTNLLQGQHVHKGEELAVISNPAFIQLQQDYLETKGKLVYAKAELERQKELVSDDAAPVKSLQRAQADLASLQAQLAGQEARLRIAGLPIGAVPFATRVILRAPKDCYVRDVHITVGQSLTPTDPICLLVDPTHMHVELTVFEKDIPKLYTGQKIRFTLPNNIAGEQTAHIYLIGQNVDEATRSVRVHGHLDKENIPGLLPGMFVRAWIEDIAKKARVLPDAAIVDYEGASYVFRQAGKVGTFSMVPIEKGEQADGFTEVRLPDSTQIGLYVVSGAYSLLGKMKNTPEED